MPNHRPRSVIAVCATLLILAVVTAGCGRRGLPAEAGVDDAAATQAAATTGPTIRPTIAASVSPPSAAATSQPVTSVPVASPQPTAPPLVMPDLTAVDDLLNDLDAALGADATADTDEGSPR